MSWRHRLASRRPPNRIIGPLADPYLNRWYLIPRNKIFNIYLHEFRRSDDDRALHDHPWISASIILSGGYLEHLEGGVAHPRPPGSVVLRLRPSAGHRVELVSGVAWTIFLTGPVVRQWGFQCPWGWRPWTEFVKLHSGGNEIGPGCD